MAFILGMTGSNIIVYNVIYCSSAGWFVMAGQLKVVTLQRGEGQCARAG